MVATRTVGEGTRGPVAPSVGSSRRVGVAGILALRPAADPWALAEMAEKLQNFGTLQAEMGAGANTPRMVHYYSAAPVTSLVSVARLAPISGCARTDEESVQCAHKVENHFL